MKKPYNKSRNVFSRGNILSDSGLVICGGWIGMSITSLMVVASRLISFGNKHLWCIKFSSKHPPCERLVRLPRQGRL
jgi:hypothetical protein